ncbi:hypothetical protein [Streptomyces mirabilis]|uniref:hypothetical protein n=1 Tax=Streptomyces mirabilis TaxID=68239 RepID=UPI0036CCBE1E
MAILEDASTPAVATGTGQAAITTASFSPPANSLLVVLVGAGWSGSQLGAAISDSVSGAWTPAVMANDLTSRAAYGYAAVFFRYLSSAPGAMTVTATYSGFSGAGAGGRLLAVRVLTGAASVQNGATAKRTLNAYTNSLTTSITTTTAGSVVYGIADDARSAETMAASSGTSFCSANGGTNPFPSSNDTVTLAAIKSVQATGSPGSLSLGVSLSAASDQGELALFEVLPSGGTPVSKVPVPRTWTTGEVVTDTEMNTEVRNAVSFLLSPPRAVVTVLGAPFNVPTGNATGPITAWDTQISNSDTMWSPSKPSRLTANTPGRYQLTIYIHFQYSSAATTANFHVGLALNSNGAAWSSANQLEEDARPGTTSGRLGTSCSLTFEQFLNTGDYVEAYAFHNTGNTESIPNTQFSCQFSALWVSSQ